MARAVGDMALARAEKSVQRYYSLSAQIQRERKDYYDRLEATQKGDLDVTAWLEWFLACLLRAVQGAGETLASVLAKARFWQHWAGMPLNDRQIKLLNRLLDGFDGKLTSSKWAAIAKCSQDTALRDISELLERGVLKKSAASGRSTSYEINAACVQPAHAAKALLDDLAVNHKARQVGQPLGNPVLLAGQATDGPAHPALGGGVDRIVAGPIRRAGR